MKRQIFSYLAVAVIALLTALTSCDKNDDPVYTGVKLLDTETSGLFHSRKYMYDNKNRMKEIWTYSGGILFEKGVITYTGEDLTKLEYVYIDEEGEFVGVDTRNYVKNGNTISYSIGVEIIEGEGEGSQSLNHTITLNNDGFPEKLESILIGYTTIINFTYHNGNQTKMSSVSDFDGTREVSYTYGAYRSPFSDCNTPKWFMFLFYGDGNHNIVTKSEGKYVDAMGFGGEWPETYEYEFGRDGFPIKIFHGTGDITEYKYKNEVACE